MKTLGFLGCAAALIAAAGHANAIDKSWNLREGNWNTAANWLTPGVPLAADNVYIGNTAAAYDAFVNLSVNATVASMTITDGMLLNTQSSRMVVTGDTTISGYNTDGIIGWPSRIQVRNGPNFAYDYVTDNLTVSNDAWVEMRGGGLEVQGLLLINDTAVVSGEGTVRLTSNAAIALRNNGGIGVGTDGLTITQAGTGRIDLDGTVIEDKVISCVVTDAEGVVSHLTINGDQLADTYDEGFRITEGGYITMNLADGWAMGSLSSLVFSSNPSYNYIARLNGTSLDFAGDIEMSGTATHGQINTPITLQPAASAVVGPQDVLEINAAATVSGGDYTVELDGEMRFMGPTNMLGGTFTTDAAEVSVAPLSFRGATTWNGDVTLNGRASQDANATVTGPTIIDAGAFDMDGNAGTAIWVVGNHLTVNATTIDESQNGNGFNGIMTVSGGFASRLSINLSAPGDRWFVSNTLNLGGVLNLPTTRIDGSHMHVLANLNVTGLVGVDANTTIGSTASVTFTTTTSELRVSRDTTVYSTPSFSGQGALHNLPTGNLHLYSESNLGQTALINDGAMKVSNVASHASVHRYIQTSTGSWDVQIGGNSPGVLNDLLRATGAPSTIDGIVNVQLINGYLPTIGATYLILDARQGVSGTFDNAPVTITNDGTIVEWSFVYAPNQVYVRAESVTPRCPADFNHDGIVDFFDYLDFVDAFSAEAIAADFNHDGVVDFFDYLDFVDAFAAGC